MSRNTEPSLPPSEPRPPLSSAGIGGMNAPNSSRGPNSTVPSLPPGDGFERPARVQLIAALLLGLALVAIPLYLWRRPRAVEALNAGNDGDGGALLADGGLAATSAGPGSAGGAANAASAAATPGAMTMTLMPPDAGASVAMTAPRVTECHDRGSKRTPAASCDHIPALEKGVSDAINDVGACLPSGSKGAIEYVADVSFTRKKNAVHVLVPRAGRTVKSGKEAAACATKVKAKLATLALDGVAHDHERYSIAVTATYP